MKLILFLFLLTPIYCFAQTDTITQSLVSAGTIKGYSHTWKDKDGTYHNFFQFNDRGRGDSLHTISPF